MRKHKTHFKLALSVVIVGVNRLITPPTSPVQRSKAQPLTRVALMLTTVPLKQLYIPAAGVMIPLPMMAVVRVKQVDEAAWKVVLVWGRRYRFGQCRR